MFVTANLPEGNVWPPSQNSLEEALFGVDPPPVRSEVFSRHIEFFPCVHRVFFCLTLCQLFHCAAIFRLVALFAIAAFEQ